MSSGHCKNCKTNPEIARKRGCDGKPAPAPVEKEIHEGRIYIYWNCPSHFIPHSVTSWFNMYRTVKDFTNINIGKLDEISLKFFRARDVYENKMNEYSDKKDKAIRR